MVSQDCMFKLMGVLDVGFKWAKDVYINNVNML